MNIAYQKITEQIIKALEEGTVPWQKGWLTNPAVSHNDGRVYSFLNQILLRRNGGEWLTFNQVTANGGKVKKGEHGSIVLFFNFKEEEIKDDNGNVIIEAGEPLKRKIPMPRYYYVFEVGQCEGIERKYPPKLKIHDSVAEAEQVIQNYLAANPDLRLDERIGNRAYYSLTEDRVILPERGQFTDINEFYSTAFHEMVHSTMTKERCDRSKERFGENVAFGSCNYSKEELVAEIGAVFLCEYVGIKGVFDNSASYIKGWLKVLKNDSTFIVSAASKAEKAVQYILGEALANAQNEAA